MSVYQPMYYKLFNKISDVIKELQEIQQLTEEMFMSVESGENTEDVEQIKNACLTQ